MSEKRVTISSYKDEGSIKQMDTSNDGGVFAEALLTGIPQNLDDSFLVDLIVMETGWDSIINYEELRTKVQELHD